MGSTRTEHLLDTLVNSVVDHAVVALDVDGRVRTWNPGAARLTGYQAEEIIGRHHSRFYPEADRAEGKPDRDLAVAVADGHDAQEGWRVRKDGTLFWADVVITALRGPDGRLVGFGEITRDLTDRKRSEDALRESEERFRLLVTSVADYAIYLLDDGGNVISWNIGAERLKGYRTDEIVGRHLSTFYTEEDRRNEVPQVGLEHARLHGRWLTEGWRVRRDGTRFWASVVITALVTPDGVHHGFAKVTRDLTDRKRNEDALRGILARERDAADQLRELDRMRSELVSIVAHDLRSPTGVIHHLLHQLRTDWSTTSDIEKLAVLDRIDDRTGRLASLADDLFDVSRIEAGQLTVGADPFDVGSIAEQVVADAKTQTDDRDIEIRITTHRLAMGDDRRTWQILSNLVSNALKFSPIDTAVEVEVLDDDDDIVVVVTDRGAGITTEHVDLVFERFSRLPQHGNVPGSGIGLFIARSLAEAQGGSLDVSSIEGEGSSFRLTLPAAPLAA